MFITLKKHKQIIEHKDQTINNLLTEERIILEKIIKLEKELEQARDLKNILQKFDNKIAFAAGNENHTINTSAGCELNLPDTVLQYTDDILGGKVIKQEGVKCLVIDQNGDVTTGLTKQKADKGFNYKLIRNK